MSRIDFSWLRLMFGMGSAAVLAITGVSVVTAGSAQAAVTHNVMVRNIAGSGIQSVEMWTAVESGQPVRRSGCVQVRPNTYTNARFSAYENVDLSYRRYTDNACRTLSSAVAGSISLGTTNLSNWWLTLK